MVRRVPRNYHELMAALQADAASLTRHLAALGETDGPDPPSSAESVARRLYQQRRRRQRFFRPDLFGEPAWDILLELYVAQAEERPMTTMEACAAAAVPTSTAQRCLSELKRAKLIKSSKLAGDERVRLVQLRADAYKRMTAFLESLGEAV